MKILANREAVILVCPDSLNPDLYAQLECDLFDSSINLHIEREPTNIYASISWAMPTFIAVYLAKPFVETILKKSAEDAYPALKAGITNFVHKVFSKQESIIKPRVSLTLAVYFERSGNGWVKALLWEGVPEAIQQEALENLFLLMQQESNGTISKQTLDEWADSERWGKVFLRFDLESRTWKVIDTVAEFQNSKLPPGYISE